MAKRIVEDGTGTRQPCPSEPDVSLDDMLQAMTFSLTFNPGEWRLLWRLFTVGAILSDEIQALASEHPELVGIQNAKLWDRLSTELSHILNKGKKQETYKTD